MSAKAKKCGAKKCGAPDADERSICVSNLPVTMDVNKVAGLFSDCGELNTINMLHDMATGTFSGDVFIEFATHEGAARAVGTKDNQAVAGPNGAVNIRVCKKNEGGFRECARPTAAQLAAVQKRQTNE
jgi:hypothetical protein